MVNKKIRSILRKAFVTAVTTALVATTVAGTSVTSFAAAEEDAPEAVVLEETEEVTEPEVTETTEEPEVTEVPEVIEVPEVTEVPEVIEEPEVTEVPEVEPEAEAEGEAEDEDEAEPVDEEEPEAAEDEDHEALLGLKKAGVLAENSEAEPEEAFALSHSNLNFYIHFSTNIQPAYFDIKIKNTSNQNLKYVASDDAHILSFSWTYSKVTTPGEEITLRIKLNSANIDSSINDFPIADTLKISAYDNENKIVDSKETVVNIFKPTTSLTSTSFNYNLNEVCVLGSEIHPQYHGGIGEMETFLSWEKLEGDTWVEINEGVFTVGTWRCAAKVQIKDEYANTVAFSSNYTIRVDGKRWTQRYPSDGRTAYLVSGLFEIYSPVEIETTEELKYELRSMNDVIVRCSGALDDFQALSIDDATLERDVDYTVESGSTVATIKGDYLETLAAGAHTVTFSYVGDRSASAELAVEYAPVEIETTEALKYQLRSMKEVIVRCSGALEDCEALSIDAVTLERDVDYTVESGSTVATIKAAYLETLAEGTHTVTFSYVGDRSASAELMVEYAPVEIETTEALKYQLRSMKDVVVTCSGALQDFQALSIDDATLEKDVDYTVEAGSTVATIKAAYLETLAEGTHTVTFYYAGNRTASAELTVEKANNNPCENHNVCDEVITVATQVVTGAVIVTKTIFSIISRIVGDFCGFHW